MTHDSAGPDPLPSWNDGKAKQSILTFVSKVTKEGSPEFGIPPEQVIGSVGEIKFEMRDGKPVLIRQAVLDFFDDNVFKPVAIQRNLGRRPIAAFGNSDGDLQMLQWTGAGSGTRFLPFCSPYGRRARVGLRHFSARPA